jgi:hypothetical protein
MTKYINDNGDMIVTDGMKFTVTRNNIEQNFDVFHWAKNAEGHVDGDIRAGYYPGFKKVIES